MKEKSKLSAGQATTLDAVKELFQKTKQMPTAQEVAEHIGMGAERYGRDKVYSHLRQLVQKGYLKRTSKLQPRNLVIV